MNRSTEYKREHKADFGRERIELLYEDSALCVIFKPSGILSVPYPGSRNKTAQDLLEALLRKKGSYSKTHKPFVVHRLDRDTSGIMMFAMTEQAQKKIMDSWQTMVKSRLYHAVAENPSDSSLVLPDSGTITDNLAYNSHNVGFVPDERRDGKLDLKTITAVTHYKVLQRGKKYTLFELSLETGRKNQIRAHLAHKGYVLCGDENYRARTNPFNRLALHARTLEFVHPYTGEVLKFERAEPEDWRVCVEKGLENEYRAVWNEPYEKKNIRKREESEKAFEKKAESAVSLSRKKKNSMDFIARGKLEGKNRRH